MESEVALARILSPEPGVEFNLRPYFDTMQLAQVLLDVPPSAIWLGYFLADMAQFIPGRDGLCGNIPTWVPDISESEQATADLNGPTPRHESTEK